jgi:hypothetical protein
LNQAEAAADRGGLRRFEPACAVGRLLILCCAPDATGLNHWLSVLQSGFSRSAVASGIIASTEFFQRSGRALSTLRQVSPGVPQIGPLSRVGHRLVRLWKSLAH